LVNSTPVLALGASRFDLKYSAGTLGHDVMLRSIELYGREVMPRVRSELGARSRELGAGNWKLGA
jgi:hypothetical protein